MEKLLPHVSILSLQEMALRKVAVHLWNFEPRTFRTEIPRFQYLFDFLEVWYETVISKVSDKLSKLQLTETLAIEMMRVIKPIGFQIMKWKLFHEDYLNDSNQFLYMPVLQTTELERVKAAFSTPQKEYLEVPFLKQLQWTAAGSIDYRKTAEELVRCRVFDSVKRYKLASLYCLDNYIPELWKELPQEKRRHFFTETSPITELFLHSCWPYILKGEEYKLDGMVEDSISFNQFAFEHSSSKGNKAAAKYFLQKLSPDEREASLVRAAKSSLESMNKSLEFYPSSSFPHGNISDVVFYLLSEMTREQQMQILREKPADVFGCFMYWPWQDAFLDFADTLWTWMQCEGPENRTRNYQNLLEKYQHSFRKPGCYFSNLVQNIFVSSPNEFKKYFVERGGSGSTFFGDVFTSEDTRTAIVILSNLDAGDRLKLVSSNRMLVIFYMKISRGRGHLVEMCLRESGFSKEDKASLKGAFMKFPFLDRGSIKVDPGFRRFFEFLDDTDASAQSKRCSAGETSPEAKKLSFGKEGNFTTK